MASDAYMEIETRSVIGETADLMFGMDKGRRQGAFEITSISFSADSNREDEWNKDTSTTPTTPTPTTPGARPGAGGAGKDSATSKLKETTIRGVQVKKPIDNATTSLFLACCSHTPIEWGVISLREAGDLSRKPWLIIEFSELYIDKISWDIDPDASGDAPKTFETLDFSFATIVLKYTPQDQLGAHPRMSIKGWDLKTKKPWNGSPDLESENWW